MGALAAPHLWLQLLERTGTPVEAARLRITILGGRRLLDVRLERSHWSAVDLPVPLVKLLLKLMALVLVEAELLLKVLHSLFQGVEVLVVRLGLGLQRLVHFHQIVVQGNQLLHFGECILRHFLMGLDLVLVEVLEALQFLLQLLGVSYEDLVLMRQELDALLKLFLLGVFAISNLVKVAFSHLKVMQHEVS